MDAVRYITKLLRGLKRDPSRISRTDYDGN